MVEVFINLYVLFINRGSVPAVWKRVDPILLGLLPGIALGSYVLASIHPGWLKFGTYAPAAAADPGPGGRLALADPRGEAARRCRSAPALASSTR